MSQTYADLVARIAALKVEAEEQRKRECADAIAEIRRIAAAHGLTAAEIFGRAQRTGRLAPVKFRDPTTGQTWTGRGKHPRWLAARIAAGATLESFRVPPTA